MAGALNAAAAAAQVNFALAPGRANNAVLDYTTSEGIKLYGKAVAPLDPKYDLQSGGLFTFLQKVRNRAIEQDWEAILRISVPPAALIAGQAAPTYNLVTEYGRMTMANVDASSRTYAFLESKCAELSSAVPVPLSLYGKHRTGQDWGSRERLPH